MSERSSLSKHMSVTRLMVSGMKLSGDDQPQQGRTVAKIRGRRLESRDQ
jgi:hypothetical protein